MKTKEKRLLRAIFGKKEEATMPEMPDNFPDTVLDKVGWAEHAMTYNLEYIGKTIHRLSRLHRLLVIGEKDGKQTLPDIITNNELRMALEPLLQIKRDIEEITEMLIPIYRETKPKGGK